MPIVRSKHAHGRGKVFTQPNDVACVSGGFGPEAGSPTEKLTKQC